VLFYVIFSIIKIIHVLSFSEKIREKKRNYRKSKKEKTQIKHMKLNFFCVKRLFIKFFLAIVYIIKNI